MKKSTLIMVVSLVLALALGVGGTMAYLQDTDEDVNVMTLGSVYIEQHEYERVQNEDGTYEMVTSEKYGEGYKLQEFTQGKPLYPAVGEVTDYGKIVAFDQLGEGASGSQAVLDGIQNAQDKFVLVENTGKSDAYVRTIFAFEMGTMEESRWDEIFMTSVASFTNNGDKPWKYTDIGTAVIDSNTYFLMEAVYTGADTRHVDGVLPAGEYTYCSLAQVYLKPEANNEDMVALDGNGNGTFDILVVSQAVQTQGFADAETALDTAFGDITVDNNPWKEDGVDLEGTPAFPVLVSTADELVAALEDGKDVHLTKNIKIDPASMSNAYGTTGINVKNGQAINGGGYTIDIKGAGGTWDSGINTTGGLIRDLTVTGSFRGIFINHNSTHSEPVILDNVTIEGTTYTISCDQGLNQTLTAKNSTFKGWTSFAATLGNATFIDCYFGRGNGYAYCRPYAPTAFVGCEFEAGYRLDPRAAVTFENCTLDGQPLTADNLATLVTNTDKATVK